ncbi:recombinase family protein [Amycolatopsis sp. DSM 110486]|uniref:recombinase family protein n=1 Tax=Amycolatopsis sp. DSM 110486 TaxID=2865832 RepID=UPI002107D0A7|nr:recombinase family protein [Amycolatopsis sp. DSM 110486]
MVARKRVRDGLVLDVYARVSRLGDERQRSVEGQVADCKARLVDIGAKVGKVLDADRGRSAWNPRVKRPDWDELMQRLETGASDGVIVFDLARFSRRPIEGERLISAAERGLLVLDSEGEYDLTTPSGKKAFRDQLNTAAYESDRTSTKTKRGKRLKALKGETNNSQRAFGWNEDNKTLRKSEADALADAAKRVLAFQSQDAIVIEWNRSGLRSVNGKPFTRTALRQLLLRPRNAGIAVYQNEVLREPSEDPNVPGELKRLVDVEPIFDVGTWEDLHSLYSSRRRGRPTSEAYLCSGIVHCGVCKHTLTGRPRKNMAPYPDGTVRRQYWCQPRAHAGGCGRISVDQRALDGHVLELIAVILSDPRHAAAIEASTKAAADARQLVHDELARAEQLANELSARLGREEMSLARYDAAVAPLDKKIARLRAQLVELGESAEVKLPPKLAAESLEEWRARLKAATVPERRALLARALRGRWLVVSSLDPSAPRVFDPNRISIVTPDSAVDRSAGV